LAIFSTYPWARHASKDNAADFSFSSANYKDGEFLGFNIRANSCTGLLEQGKPCLHCWRLTSKVKNLHELSKQPPGQLNYEYQTHEQLTRGHRLKNQIIKDLQLSVHQLFPIHKHHFA
jgi:hypothetical protein